MNVYRVKIENRVFDVKIVDLYARPVVAIVDGETVEVWPQREAPASAASETPAAPLPAAQPGSGTALSGQVRAPIPGVVLSLAVQPGDEVAVGQELCVLEAMKMKNTIRSPRAGRIERVLVTNGQTVRHNDVMFEFAA